MGFMHLLDSLQLYATPIEASLTNLNSTCGSLFLEFSHYIQMVLILFKVFINKIILNLDKVYVYLLFLLDTHM